MAQDQRRLEEAESWYRKSLAIDEDLGIRSRFPLMATKYHLLAIITEHQGRLEEAEGWYRKSLAPLENVEDWPRLTATYCWLGLLAEQRAQLNDALEWIVRCVALLDQTSDQFQVPRQENSRA